ncbi:MAG: carbohydrate binding family 9 domain-containing protein, partial [Thermoanaerobaculia bacterium]
MPPRRNEYRSGSTPWIPTAAGAAALLCLPAALFGQSPQQPFPTIDLKRTAVGPVIDGIPDEPAWAEAAVIDDLRQVEPSEGEMPSEHTEVRIIYDADSIYFGIRCYDREPQSIIATQLRRDGRLESDDRVELVIDPFFDRRNGFFFATNPLGARVDGLVVRNRQILEEWDGIWYAKATIDEQGWSAEIAIPFKTISFDPRTSRWSFNIERTIRRINETSRWSAPLQNKALRSIADAGILEGISGITQGVGLDVVPYTKLTFRDDEVRGDGAEADAGLDIFYKLSSSTTLALTVNTDFA